MDHTVYCILLMKRMLTDMCSQ